MRRIPALASALAIAASLLIGATAGPASAAPSGVTISQVYGGGGNSGATYTNDFIELFNTGGAPVDLTGWSIQYASATGLFSATTALAGSIPAGGYYLVQEAQGAGGTTPLPAPDASGTIAMGATAGKVRLLNASATVEDLVGYGTTANQFEGSGPAPAPSNTTADLRLGDGATDTDNNATDFVTGPPNPRNSGFTPPPPETCDSPATPIHDIQGSGLASPLAGTTASIEGVVVGDYQGSGQFGGYYVQEEDAEADADPATSEGIFVFNTATPVNVGDQLHARGTVSEFSNLTELSNLTTALVCSTGNTVSDTAVALPVGTIDDWERYEGMRISIAQDLTVTEVFTLARFGEVALSASGRLSTPTNVVSPGAPAVALQDLNDRSRILLDDGNNQQNIDPTKYPQGGLSAANTLRVGDSLAGVSGVLDQRFGDYRVQPVDTSTITFDHTNPRTPAPAAVGGNVKVASFNVLNYFNGDGAGGGFPTPRGATTAGEFARQRAKIISAITTLDADVIGLMELENDDPITEYSAIEDLVDGLNAATAPGTYAFINTGVVGTDAIRVGLVYRPAAVSPLGAYAVMDSSVDPRFIDTKNRPSIAQTFALNSNGARFTVVVNHLKSKGSDCNDVGDPDTGDGQGNCNLTRTHAAQALADWLATDPTASGDADVLLIGDMNSYAMEDPITAFRDAGYTNTVAAALGDEAYSYVFDGQSGYLDHALASPTLTGQVSGVAEWHINADEPVALDYNTEFKTANQQTSFYAPDAFRSSDHDPVVVGLDLAAYDFTGFFAPVDNPPVLNVTRAGSTVPVKFSLNGDQGLSILAAGSPSSMPLACAAGASADPIEETASTGSQGLTYDAATDTYDYNWKTAKRWTGCRRFVLTLDDGSIHYADFQFR